MSSAVLRLLSTPAHDHALGQHEEAIKGLGWKQPPVSEAAPDSAYIRADLRKSRCRNRSGALEVSGNRLKRLKNTFC